MAAFDGNPGMWAENDALMDSFYDLVMENYKSRRPYAVYIFHDRYDIPAKAADKERLGESEAVFEYLICVICPLADEYEPGEPECGFLFFRHIQMEAQT